MATDMVPVPVTGLTENFSPMPRIAPPPLGSEIDGTDRLPSPPGAGVDPAGLRVCSTRTPRAHRLERERGHDVGAGRSPLRQLGVTTPAEPEWCQSSRSTRACSPTRK